MTPFGTLPNARAGQALIDYLKSQGIEASMQSDNQGVILFVKNQYDLPFAERELDQFIHHPNDSKYLKASWNVGSTNTNFNYGNPSKQLLGAFLQGAGPLTLGIFTLCIGIFLAWNLGYANSIFSNLGYFGADGNNQLSQFWRIFTPSLLHFSSMHIIFNLLWWWYLGGKIEKKLGFGTLFILLLIGGTLPNIAQAILSGPNFGGLSGVVYALAGYSWIMGKQKPQAGIELPSSYMAFMMIWLLLGFTNFLGISMANAAHVGGLLVGLIQGFYDSKKNR